PPGRPRAERGSEDRHFERSAAAATAHPTHSRSDIPAWEASLTKPGIAPIYQLRVVAFRRKSGKWAYRSDIMAQPRTGGGRVWLAEPRDAPCRKENPDGRVEISEPSPKRAPPIAHSRRPT